MRTRMRAAAVLSWVGLWLSDPPKQSSHPSLPNRYKMTSSGCDETDAAKIRTTDIRLTTQCGRIQTPLSSVL